MMNYGYNTPNWSWGGYGNYPTNYFPYGYGYNHPYWQSGFAPVSWNQPYGQGFAPNAYPPGFGPGFGGWGPGPAHSGWGLGGLRKWGGTYSPQYATTGLPTDEEITEMIYDAIDVDPLIPYDANIEVDVDSGIVTLSGTVLNKTVKHATGDDCWWIPGVVDVRNELMVSGPRRSRSAPLETEEGRNIGPKRRGR